MFYTKGILMDKERIKTLFIDNSVKYVMKLKVLLADIRGCISYKENEYLMAAYISAHSLNSMSVFLPIKEITAECREIEKTFKAWVDGKCEITLEDLKKMDDDIEKLGYMIENISLYYDES